MASIVTLIKCLPILLGLIQAMQKAIDEAETNQEVADHLAIVKKAFDEKDAAALNKLFNS